jgi:hypothetical protein
MQSNLKTNGKNPSPALAKGQVWRTERGDIRIMELGQMLVHYKMQKDLRQMQRTQMSRIDNMKVYLKTNGAQLVESKAAAAQRAAPECRMRTPRNVQVALKPATLTCIVHAK